MELSNIDEFDKVLVETIDLVLRECLGDVNAEIIYEYLERRSCSMSEIPQKLDFFSNELRALLGFGKGQILGSGAILEETIANVLCYEMGITPNITGPIKFANFVKELKEIRHFAEELRKGLQEKKRNSQHQVGILRSKDAAIPKPTGGERK